MATDRVHISVTWSNLTYRLPDGKFILRDLSGSARSGELMALMGPSGAGKTTLLQCLAGYRCRGLTGNISVRTTVTDGDDRAVAAATTERPRRIKLGFLPQVYHFGSSSASSGQLTVRESIHWAATMQCPEEMAAAPAAENGGLRPEGREALVGRILEEMDLQGIGDRFTSECSAGERKRLAIALETLSRPDVLLLDEPTTGLDPKATIGLVRRFHDKILPRNPQMIILATIHQPPSRVVHLFSGVYVLSADGRRVFQGPPGGLMRTLESKGLAVPNGYNPADLIIEVAAFLHGRDLVAELAHESSQRSSEVASVAAADHKNELYLQSSHGRDPWRWPQVGYWSGRALTMAARNWPFNVAFLAMHALFVAANFGAFGKCAAEQDGCPARRISLWEASIGQLDGFMAAQRSDLRRDWDISLNLFFFVSYVGPMTFLATCSTVLTVASEFPAVRNEVRNGWYPTAAYSLGRMVAEGPYLILPAASATLMYLLTGQPTEDWWRLGIFVAGAILNTLAYSSLGFLVGSIFYFSEKSAAITASILAGVSFILMPFNIRFEDTPAAFRVAALLNPMTHTVRLWTAAVYGFGRCHCDWTDDDNDDYDAAPAWHSCIAINVDYTDDDDEDYPMDPMNWNYSEPTAGGGICVDNDWNFAETFDSVALGGRHGALSCDASDESSWPFVAWPLAEFDMTEDEAEVAALVGILYLIFFIVVTRLGAHLTNQWNHHKQN